MSSNFTNKNLYAILGVQPSADKDTIKDAYRTLAKKYHPDTNKGNKASEKRFKEVKEAYDVLSDDKKRKEYDKANNYNQPQQEKPKSNYSQTSQAKQAYTKQSSPPPRAKKEEKQSQKPKQPEKPFSETFSKFVNDVFAPKQEAPNKPVKGTDINIDLTISIHESQNGTVRRVNVLHTECCPQCKGKKFINGAKCKKCGGNGEISSQKTILVKIPPQIKQGEKIKLVNEGNIGQFGGANGDLYLKINIEKNDLFRFDDLNVLSDIPISPTEAALGTSILVPSIDGHINMKIPPETSSGQKFRLHEQGVYDKNGNKKGDHIVTVYIKMPKNLSPEEKELYQKLAKLRDFNPRKEG